MLRYGGVCFWQDLLPEPKQGIFMRKAVSYHRFFVFGDIILPRSGWGPVLACAVGVACAGLGGCGAQSSSGQDGLRLSNVLTTPPIPPAADFVQASRSQKALDFIPVADLNAEARPQAPAAETTRTLESQLQSQGNKSRAFARRPLPPSGD